jgi:hypothetical protein
MESIFPTLFTDHDAYRTGRLGGQRTLIELPVNTTCIGSERELWPNPRLIDNDPLSSTFMPGFFVELFLDACAMD